MIVGLPNSQISYKGVVTLAKAQRNLENASRGLVENSAVQTFFNNVKFVNQQRYPIKPEDAWKIINTTIQNVPENQRSIHKGLDTFLQVAKKMLGITE